MLTLPVDGATLGLPLSTLFAFLLVLARVAGFATFMPIPALRAAPDAVRVTLAVAITMALFPVWPQLENRLPTLGSLAVLSFTEAGFGLAAGLAVNFLTEGFQVAAQLIGLQAGFGYATTIDPNSQTDSGLLQVITNLLTGLLLFTFGIDRELIRVLAASFEKFPAGSWALSAASVDGIIKLGAGMFSIGLRMALPIMALLLLIDLSLALVGRMQQHFQMHSLAFPVKILVAVGMLAILAPTLAHLFSGASAATLGLLWKSVGF